MPGPNELQLRTQSVHLEETNLKDTAGTMVQLLLESASAIMNTPLSLYHSQPPEISGGICTVNLEASALGIAYSDYYKLSVALATTLCALDEISGVNVLTANQSVALDVTGSLPMGTLSGRGKFFLDLVDAVDFWFIWGGDYAGVCRELRLLTGVTPMLPKWAFGYVQSKERYASQEDLLAIARRYREEGIPIDTLVQDWLYWDDGLWGNKHFDKERYPDPKALTDALHGMDLRLMISIWPNLSGESEDRIEMREAGYLLGDGSTVNAFDENARALYWKEAYEGLFRYGIDGWWCDSSEPFDAVWGGRERAPLPERMAKSVGEFKKYLDDSILNVYSLHHSRGMYENQRKCSEKRVVNLTRSGFSGQHRYGTVVWSGAWA